MPLSFRPRRGRVVPLSTRSGPSRGGRNWSYTRLMSSVLIPKVKETVDQISQQRLAALTFVVEEQRLGQRLGHSRAARSSTPKEAHPSFMPLSSPIFSNKIVKGLTCITQVLIVTELSKARGIHEVWNFQVQLASGHC